MGRIDKDGYERKAAYAARKFRENAEIAIENGMSEEQLELIDQITEFRHWLHVTVMNSNGKSAFCMSGPEYDRIAQECSDYNDEGIVERFTAAFGFKPFNRCDWPTDEEYDEDEQEEYCVYVDKSQSTIIERFAAVDKSIIESLQRIDNKFGTDFCPTGFSRIF